MDLWKVISTVYFLTIARLTEAQIWNARPDMVCLSPYNAFGTCKRLDKCPYMMNLVEYLKASSDQKIFLYLKRSGCGYDGKMPKVCCVEENEHSETVTEKSPPELPLAPDCGKTPLTDFPRVVGGQPASLGQWPWMAALYFRDVSMRKNFWGCGGMLINNRFVLSAAHCILSRNKLIKVRLGALNLDDKLYDGATPKDFFAERIISHSGFSNLTGANDIALIKLNETVYFTDHIQPICLPQSPKLRSETFVGYHPYVAGWGTTESARFSSHLQYVQLPVVPNKYCQRRLGQTYSGIVISDSQFCAGYDEGGKDSCVGDSGGPLMWPSDHLHYYAIGLVSFGSGCGKPGLPGVYTKVSAYIRWIKENMDD